MEANLKIIPPNETDVPNSVKFETPPGKRQDGFKPVKDEGNLHMISEETAIEYGEALKQAFIEEWKRQNSK